MLRLHFITATRQAKLALTRHIGVSQALSHYTDETDRPTAEERWMPVGSRCSALANQPLWCYCKDAIARYSFPLVLSSHLLRPFFSKVASRLILAHLVSGPIQRWGISLSSHSVWSFHVCVAKWWLLACVELCAIVLSSATPCAIHNIFGHLSITSVTLTVLCSNKIFVVISLTSLKVPQELGVSIRSDFCLLYSCSDYPLQ